MTITTVTPEVKRDRYGRPFIVPKNGTKPVPYTRATTFVSAFEDTYHLELWKMRQAAIGLSMRPDLQLAIAAHRDDKRRLNEICKEALEAASSSAAATRGTALHSLTEQVDRGHELSGIPADAQADLDAYVEATKDLKPVYIEQMVVNDSLRVAGTPDRVVTYQGKRYIADLKTGNVDLGAGKIAAQLAMYARSEVYDIATGERSIHGAELDKGLVFHLPAGEAKCEVKWIDLLAGWEIVLTCRDVRKRREIKSNDLYAPFGVDLLETLSDSLVERIKQCVTADEVRSLWTEDWDDHLNQVARDHIASLPAAS